LAIFTAIRRFLRLFVPRNRPPISRTVARWHGDKSVSFSLSRASRQSCTLQRTFIALVTGLVLRIPGAPAGELPQYELTGFPITPLQFSVVGPAGIQERSPTSALTVAGMPTSPHQIAVISPRTKQQVAVSTTEIRARPQTSSYERGAPDALGFGASISLLQLLTGRKRLQKGNYFSSIRWC
jgi:hypothetical protein